MVSFEGMDVLRCVLFLSPSLVLFLFSLSYTVFVVEWI